ncbi:MAG: response regulator [Acidobacteriota bacterium]
MTILLVDDNPDDRELTLRELKRHNHRNVVIVRDGVEALEHILGAGQTPQLVLLDLHMPRLSGLEVLRRLRADARTRELPVVILTSSDNPQDRRDAESFGASFLHKPLNFAEFAKVTGRSCRMMAAAAP